MRRRTPTGVLAVATVAGGLLLPLAPTASAADSWAPARTGQGHPRAMVTLDSGPTIAISDGGWVTRRAAGESVWSPARHEIDERRKSRTKEDWVLASGNSVIASFADSTKFGTFRSTYVWRPGAGWSESIAAKGLVWAGQNGVVGIDRKRFVPGRGWTTLPEIPLEARAMAADAKGRISTVGRKNGDLRITRFTPGHGWARPVRFTGADRSNGAIDLAVSPRGDRAITMASGRRLVLFRKLGAGDWRRFVVDRTSPNEHHVELDRFGRASVVWTRYTNPSDDGVYARRLGPGAAWSRIQLLGNGSWGLVVDGTPSGRLAVAYGNRRERNGASHVLIRSSDGHWGDPVKVAPYGNRFGLALSDAGCATGYAWTGRLSRFTARTLGSCAGSEPEPTDPRTAWDPLAGPTGERATPYAHGGVTRTSDGHTLLAWQQWYGKIRAAERTGSGFDDVSTLNPSGVGDCFLVRLAAVDTRVRAILDCSDHGYPRGLVERTWTAALGWSAATRLPVRGVEIPVDISGEGRMAVAVDPGYDRRVDKVAYRDSLDGEWTMLPRPPRFASPYVTWTLHVTDAGDVVLLDEYGREYVTYRESTGTWSPVRKAPITSATGELWNWQVTDTGFLMTTATGYREQRVAVGEVGGTWRKPNPLPGSRCRSFHLSDDGVVTIVETATSCGRSTTLRSRDLQPGSSTWSGASVIGHGSRLQHAYLYGNPNGDLLVRLAHPERFGFARPDTLWRRPAGSTWSQREYVPGGYGLRGTVLTDGTVAVTTPYRSLAPGAWLSLHD